ncbi:hypothetical protein [Streptococcus merionis]|uniref:hypothetical protein n=1 Tax=Streptococcus merionis TaxID=400065 RepID=UPI0003685C97|nr:hypothetical protein [Streptococcus merionis]
MVYYEDRDLQSRWTSLDFLKRLGVRLVGYDSFASPTKLKMRIKSHDFIEIDFIVPPLQRSLGALAPMNHCWLG